MASQIKFMLTDLVQLIQMAMMFISMSTGEMVLMKNGLVHLIPERKDLQIIIHNCFFQLEIDLSQAMTATSAGAVSHLIPITRPLLAPLDFTAAHFAMLHVRLAHC